MYGYTISDVRSGYILFNHFFGNILSYYLIDILSPVYLLHIDVQLILIFPHTLPQKLYIKLQFMVHGLELIDLSDFYI